ncbi:MAG: alpha,alpha-trehalose-phosphate synthase (UDP-forming) [Parasphingopyxis sp.]
MSRLIVISNRVSVPKAQGAAGAQGGLAVALLAALRESRGIWFGWSGEEVEQYEGKLDIQRHVGVTTVTVDLERQDIEEYYNGYANRTLWPLFHYRIDLAEYERTFGSGYERVNEKLAEAVAPLIEPDDLVWVHDYHMIPLGKMLRDRGIANRIGFFLHIPWPPTRLFVSLPFHERLVRTMLEYDLIGFQTEEWLESFTHYIEKELGGAIDEEGCLSVDDKTVRARAFPIGIDFAEFTEAGRGSEAKAAYAQLKSSAQEKKVLIGVDRLDYSKGVEERFEGYERFLEGYPERREDVLLLQIAPPSRGEVHTYREIRERLETLSGHINGGFAEVDWVPIRYVNRGYPRSALAGLYRASAIALVTPLRDGMNLVAKEYVAAQDPEDPGVLILSRFAGAALQLEDALLVNPHSADEVSEAIRQALDMPREERVGRWKTMYANVRDEDVNWWRNRFVEALAG